MFQDLALADFKRTRFAAAVLLHLRDIPGIRDPHQLLKRPDDLLLCYFVVGGRDQTAFDAAGRLNDDRLIGRDGNPTGIKVVNLPPVFELNSDYLCHDNTLSVRRARRDLIRPPTRSGNSNLFSAAAG